MNEFEMLLKAKEIDDVSFSSQVIREDGSTSDILVIDKNTQNQRTEEIDSETDTYLNVRRVTVPVSLNPNFEFPLLTSDTVVIDPDGTNESYGIGKVSPIYYKKKIVTYNLMLVG